MADFKEQRICIKFCFRISKTAEETYEMLTKVFGDNAMSESDTILWYNRFKEGRTSVLEDDEQSEQRPSSEVKPKKKPAKKSVKN